MATAPIRYAEVRAALDAPLSAVWTEIACFGGLERWAAGVTACAVDGAGVGAVRTIDLGGRVVRERLERLDAAEHAITYLILDPHTMPAADVRGTMRLSATAAGGTDLLWFSEARDLRVAPEVLGERIEAFYRASIEGLRGLLKARSGRS